jgi:hypothetical protein
MSMELIQRIASGNINQVNDSVAGGGGGNIGPQVGLAPGQLGKILELDDSELIFNSAVGTVLGGGFRYVQLSAGSTPNPVVGQIVFWDAFANSADNLFVVTTLENGTVPGAQYPAGIVLSSTWGAGNFSIIQCWGPTFIKFRAALTHAPAGIGEAVFCAAAGAGADNGFADTIANANPATWSDSSLFLNRYLGPSIQLPTNGGLKLVNLRRLNERG